jgi:aminoglycoside phosphotransferase (APT) family kinase protein
MIERIAHLLPEEVVGRVTAVQPISMGLSGAAVYAVSSARGELVLRVHADPATWERLLLVLRRTAAGAVAPPLVHVDEAARAVVSVRVAGAPLTVALADPAQRGAVIAGAVAQLRALHALDATGLAASDPVDFARAQHAAQRARPGFPVWAAGIEPILDEVGERLARDPRRVLSHNDPNPGNILWDGARAWLVDWEVAGPGHPFYDLAVLAMFLQLDDATAAGLLGLQEQRRPDEDELATLAALRRVAALLCGLVFMSLVPDLALLPASPPALSEVYAEMRAGRLDLQDPRGRAAFATALLSLGVGS